MMNLPVLSRSDFMSLSQGERKIDGLLLYDNLHEISKGENGLRKIQWSIWIQDVIYFGIDDNDPDCTLRCVANVFAYEYQDYYGKRNFSIQASMSKGQLEEFIINPRIQKAVKTVVDIAEKFCTEH